MPRVLPSGAPMDRFQEAVSEVARTTAEAQLEIIERSVAQLVRRELAALAAGEPEAERGSSWLGGGRAAARSAGAGEVVGPAAAPGVRFAPVLRTDAQLTAGRVTYFMGTNPDTIWEASMLVGLPIMGRVGTVILSMGFFSSTFMQVFVILMLSKGMVQVPIHKAQKLLLWPIYPLSGGPDGKLKAPMENSGSSLPALPFMCLSSMLLWMFIVARDIRHTLNFVSAVCSLPRGETVLARSSDMHGLVSVSLPRLLLTVFITSMRLSIACTLLVIGSQRLNAARVPTDLLLSAATLGFALDVPRRAWAWGIAVQRLVRSSLNWNRE